MIRRENYLEKLSQLKDKKIIKVITGVRRCGKSTLLELFRDELIETGVPPERIRSINFEKAENLPLADWKKLHDDISAKLLPDEKNYIFLDEIQNVDSWEKMVDSLYTKDNVDLYLTGSNAYFLSSEFATILSGRQMEIKVLPFSFAEYLMTRQDETPKDRQAIFMEYLRHGGMPQSVEMFRESEALGIDYLTGIYNTVVLNDVMTRQGVNDSEALGNIMKFVFDSVGKPLSPKKIADYMGSNYRKISSRTVEIYLAAATEAFILYGVDRFDIKGKELLQTQQKYYLVDTGLRHVLLAHGEQFNSGRALENVVYLELLRRGYQVWIGKTKSGKEVDFVAKSKLGVLEYYQVTETMRGEETRERELLALRNIDDNNRKVVLTLDPESNNYAGIEQVNVVDWLMRG